MTKSATSSKRSTIEDRRSKFLDSIERVEIDNEAFTIKEIMELKNLKRWSVQELVRDNLAMGTWEQVQKQGPTRFQTAYRLKGK